MERDVRVDRCWRDRRWMYGDRRQTPAVIGGQAQTGVLPTPQPSAESEGGERELELPHRMRRDFSR